MPQAVQFRLILLFSLVFAPAVFPADLPSDSPVYEVQVTQPEWKTRLDWAVILLTSPVTLPVMGAIAVAVAFVDGTPVIFTQDRLGRNGEPFRIYKFRTMRTGMKGPSVTEVQDPRVTRLGAFLRRFHLDELPQLWNILLGDMSLVGPRPHCVDIGRELSLTVPGYAERYAVLPGLTGPAQISLAYCDSEESECQRALLDQKYLRTLSIRQDLKVLFQTFVHVLLGHGTR